MLINYLMTVFDNVDVSIILVSVEPEGRFKALLTNKTFGKTAGFPNDIVGKYLDEVASPQTYEQFSRPYQKVVQSKQTLEYSDWVPVPSGRRAYEVKMIPVLSTLGECVQIVAISRDVTKQYDMYGELCAATALAEYLAPRSQEICVVVDKELVISYTPKLPKAFADWQVGTSLTTLVSKADYEQFSKRTAGAQKKASSGNCIVAGQSYTYTVHYNAKHSSFVISFSR
jgi:hypothetical protein